MFLFFFFNDTATTEIYTLSLHDALPIFFEFLLTRRKHLFRRSDESSSLIKVSGRIVKKNFQGFSIGFRKNPCQKRSEEHTSELQSRPHLVCRPLLEKITETRSLRLLDRQ